MYHGVLLWNFVTVDWLSVDMWFGTGSASGARKRERRLVHALFIA